MAEQVKRLPAFPGHAVLGERAVRGKVSELELLERFGPPTTARDQFDDPRLFWDLEWPCGLVMAIEYHQLTEDFTMLLDADDEEHALRHLAVDVRDTEESFDRRRDRFDRVNPRPSSERWSVVSESQDGHRAVLARNLTERDAMCRRNELVSRDRTLTYRVEPTRA